MSFSSSKNTTSKKPNSSSTTNHIQPKNQQKAKVGPRRSQSVSAFSRTHLDITSDFNNTRDNPLFWSDGLDSSDQLDCVSSNGDDIRRGRSVTRNSVGGERKGFGGGGGRSLSTVDTGRRRSPSRGRGFGNNKSGREQESRLLSSVGRNKKVVSNGNQILLDDKNKLVRRASDLSEVLKGSKTWSSQHPAFETSDTFAVSLSEREQESEFLSNLGSNSTTGLDRNQRLLDGKNKLVRSASDLSEVLKGSITWSSQNHAFETSDDSAVISTPHCDDRTPARPISEFEERTIKPVSEERKVIHWGGDNDTGGEILETVRTEVRRAISNMHKDLKEAMLRSDSDVLTDTMFFDVAPELANPNMVELVSDFREEFTRELEECEERTRNLRAELAVEEHRELELNQILSDMIPEPETPEVQKPRFVRKGTIERRKMSKCLEEEALAYFDECVSISTFDDSDFSSLEDPPSHKSRAGETSYLPSALNRNSIPWSLDSQDVIRQSSPIKSNELSNLSVSGLSNTSCGSGLNSLNRRQKFSFTSELSDSTSHEQGIRNCVKLFSKDKEQETAESHILRVVPQKSERYESEIPMEKFLLDRMSFRSRIESGGMLLCGGGIGFPRSPFSSFW